MSRLCEARRSQSAGLIAAGLVAWALTTVVDLGGFLLSNALAPVFGQWSSPTAWRQVWRELELYALVGIPVALVVSVPVGLVAWTVAERRGATDARGAAQVGAAAGILVGLVSIAITLLESIAVRLDYRSSFNVHGLGGWLVLDGVTTPLGWLYELLELAATTATGAAAGLVAWRVGRPRC